MVGVNYLVGDEGESRVGASRGTMSVGVHCSQPQSLLRRSTDTIFVRVLVRPLAAQDACPQERRGRGVDRAFEMESLGVRHNDVVWYQNFLSYPSIRTSTIISIHLLLSGKRNLLVKAHS